MYSVKLLTQDCEVREARLATLPEAVAWAAALFPKFDSYDTVRRTIAKLGGYADGRPDHQGNFTLFVIIPPK